MSYLQKIKEVGIGEAIIIAIKKYLDIDILKLHYLRLNTDINKIDTVLLDFTLSFKDLCYEDFQKGNAENFTEDKLKLIKERLDGSEYHSWGILENDILAYSTWVSVGNLGLPYGKKKIPLLFNEGLLEDSYCDPIARGKGYHGLMNYIRIKKLYQMGRNRVIAIVLETNAPAMKVQKKCGFEDLGVFYCGKIFGTPFCTLNKKKYDNK